MIRFNSAEQFMEALEARRTALLALDDGRLVQHRQAERDHLKAFKAACREAAKWDYETAKEHDFRLPSPDGLSPSRYSNRWQSPTCPISEIGRLDRLLAQLAATRQKTFTVEERGTWATAYHLLTVGAADERSDLCS